MEAPAPELYPNAAADPGTATALRRLRRQVVVAAALAVTLLAGAYACGATAEYQSAELLRTGVRVPGLVADTWVGAKGQRFMSVAYNVHGVGYRERVAIGSVAGHQCGTLLTVVADPANPAHMRTLTDSNDSLGLVVPGAMLLGLGITALLLTGLLGPTARSTRRRCQGARWVAVELAEPRTWRKRRGVTLRGEQVEVVVTPVRTPLVPPLWALSDSAPGRTVVLRYQRDGRWGGPVRISGLRAWPSAKLAGASTR